MRLGTLFSEVQSHKFAASFEDKVAMAKLIMPNAVDVDEVVIAHGCCLMHASFSILLSVDLFIIAHLCLG